MSNQDKYGEPESEVFQMAQQIMQGQPFPYAMIISEGYKEAEGIQVYIDSDMKDGQHAGAMINCLRHLADQIEEEWF